jgi:hypothetical protein
MDPKNFKKCNITDTCSVWNVLLSSTLYLHAVNYGIEFYYTDYVEFECIGKPRTHPTDMDKILVKRFNDACKNNSLKKCVLTIEDLQDSIILNNRHKFGYGELSSLVFAIKTNQAFMTDDQAACKLASQIAPKCVIQTTPHLLAFLFFNNELGDLDVDNIIKEHKTFDRGLEKYFCEAYEESCRCKLNSK